jgi:hypothetical protein
MTPVAESSPASVIAAALLRDRQKVLRAPKIGLRSAHRRKLPETASAGNTGRDLRTSRAVRLITLSPRAWFACPDSHEPAGDKAQTERARPRLRAGCAVFG